MTHDEIKALKKGDRVKWTDPDEGRCSRIYTLAKAPNISRLEYDNEVTLIDEDGSELQAFAHELG